MYFLINDPRRGGSVGLIHRISNQGLHECEFPVGYSAEVSYSPQTNELFVLESDPAAQPMKHYLRVIGAAQMRDEIKREIPVRPMYAGFPGRSTRCPLSPSGRYIYFMRLGPYFQSGEDLVFRLTPTRWDRRRDTVEAGHFFVDSCQVEYGLAGGSEDEIFIHLSCEFASTVAFGSFGSEEHRLLRMENLPLREHGPLETNGSWLDRATNRLYCVNRSGTIYEVGLAEKTCRVLAVLRLGEDQAVPIHQIFGAAGEIHIGVALKSKEMGLGMITEIWSVSADTGEFLGRRLLPHSVMNFVVTPDGRQLAAVNPYSRVAFAMDRATGEDVWRLNRCGDAPAEIIIVP